MLYPSELTPEKAGLPRQCGERVSYPTPQLVWVYSDHEWPAVGAAAMLRGLFAAGTELANPVQVHTAWPG